MESLSRQDIQYIIRLLQAVLRQPEELDTEDDDVLRWEQEGGSPK